MTHSEGVPPWARPVLEALRDDATLRNGPAMYEARRNAAGRLAHACTAALAAASGPDAGTGERELCGACIGEGCEVCDGVGFTVDAQHAADCDGTCRNCPVPVQTPCERCAPASGAAPEQGGPGVAEVEAFERRVREVGRVEALRELERPAPAGERDPELDDLLKRVQNAAFQHGEGLHEGKPMDCPNCAKTAAAIHAHVAQRERAAREAGRAEGRAEWARPSSDGGEASSQMAAVLDKMISEHGAAISPTGMSREERCAHQARRDNYKVEALRLYRAEMGEVVSSGMVTGRSWEGGPVPRFTHLTLSVTDASALPLGTPVDLVRRRGKGEGS